VGPCFGIGITEVAAMVSYQATSTFLATSVSFLVASPATSQVANSILMEACPLMATILSAIDPMDITTARTLTILALFLNLDAVLFLILFIF